ncbi:hypothetical protein MKW92_031514 [Papaver armeniacum]|nr:hypothetical protein MKW92_031514 [Papaver armeniacum]
MLRVFRVFRPLLLSSNNNLNSSIRISSNTKSSSLSNLFSTLPRLCSTTYKTRVITATASMATTSLNVPVETLPPVLDSTSEPPSVFDGTTRLYISYVCPYAQRAWITRNCKGLQEKIRLVALELTNKPDWYKEKVYPPNKLPALEHNNQVIGESLDVIKYLDTNFEGPALLPNDPAKREFAEELLAYTGEFGGGVIGSVIKRNEDFGAHFDYLEAALSKFPDGPFFLGEFSLADIAYAPFVERYQPLLLDVKKCDITTGRPKLTAWIEELNKINAYTQTKYDTAELLAALKRVFGL